MCVFSSKMFKQAKRSNIKLNANLVIDASKKYYPLHILSLIIEEKTVVNLPTKNVSAKTTLKPIVTLNTGNVMIGILYVGCFGVSFSPYLFCFVQCYICNILFCSNLFRLRCKLYRIEKGYTVFISCSVSVCS